MNIYIVTEGKVEKQIYRHWIPYVNPQMSPVEHISRVVDNNFIIFQGHGQPDNFFEACRRGVCDVNDNVIFDRLVLVADSEESNFAEKYQEIQFELERVLPCRIPYYIVIQEFCIETWGLANGQIIRRRPRDAVLSDYVAFYDVSQYDPTLLPNYNSDWTRANFAKKYLRLAIHDIWPTRSYSCKNPHALYPREYYDQIYQRYEQTNHISSFSSFLIAFSP